MHSLQHCLHKQLLSGHRWLKTGKRMYQLPILLRRQLYVSGIPSHLMLWLTGIVETTQADVKAELLAEEQAEQAQGPINNDPPPVHMTTMSTFLSMGLNLEDHQWVNTIFTSILPINNATSFKAKQLWCGQGLYAKGVMERCHATLCERIESWQSIQAPYMPGIAQLCQMSPTRTDAMPSDQDAKKLELIQLWLPSFLPTGLCEMGCVNGLVDKECCLQLAEADDALVPLRHQLCITTRVFNYKKTHVSGTGQKANTRAWTMLS